MIRRNLVWQEPSRDQLISAEHFDYDKKVNYSEKRKFQVQPREKLVRKNMIGLFTGLKH